MQHPIGECRDLKQALQQRDRDGLQLSVRRDAPAAVASDDAEFSLADDAPVEASVTTVTLQQRAVVRSIRTLLVVASRCRNAACVCAPMKRIPTVF